MHALVLLCALLAAPFWESKAPADWTADELAEILHRSPWARVATAEGFQREAGVQTLLSSALPMQLAEAESLRRRAMPVDADEFRQYLAQEREKSIILTVNFPDPNQLADGKEAKRMEEECVMKVGRKKYNLKGHFPPTPSDPYLRLVFPRAVTASDKLVQFELYLPGVTPPYRIAEYVVKELVYRGKLEL